MKDNRINQVLLLSWICIFYTRKAFCESVTRWITETHFVFLSFLFCSSNWPPGDGQLFLPPGSEGATGPILQNLDPVWVSGLSINRTRLSEPRSPRRVTSETEGCHGDKHHAVTSHPVWRLVALQGQKITLTSSLENFFKLNREILLKVWLWLLGGF